MKSVYISDMAYLELTEYIISKGYEAVRVLPEGKVHPAMASHPDVYMCKLGASPESPVFFGCAEKLTPDYPGDARYNALCVGRYFIHNLKCTDPNLLRASLKHGLIPIDVRQGYAKCSAVAVDDKSVITSDIGIKMALSALGDIAVLSVVPGHVSLPGFPSGFLGGASGRIGNEIVFCGDLSLHPDGERIRDFIEARGLGVKDFKGQPLLDIGTIIEFQGVNL